MALTLALLLNDAVDVPEPLREDEPLPVDDDDGVPLLEPVPDALVDGEAPADRERVIVADALAVPLLLADGEPVADDDGVPLSELDGVPDVVGATLRLDDAVGAAVSVPV